MNLLVRVRQLEYLRLRGVRCLRLWRAGPGAVLRLVYRLRGDVDMSRLGPPGCSWRGDVDMSLLAPPGPAVPLHHLGNCLLLPAKFVGFMVDLVLLLVCLLSLLVFWNPHRLRCAVCLLLLAGPAFPHACVWMHVCMR